MTLLVRLSRILYFALLVHFIPFLFTLHFIDPGRTIAIQIQNNSHKPCAMR